MRKNPYADTPMEAQLRPDVSTLRTKIVEKLPTENAASDSQFVVTVVTAVFQAIQGGRKEELQQCLDSVQEQTGITLEHLIVDGASSDGTVELIQSYQNKKVPIRLLSEPDAGIYDAMNRGLYLARGKYVIFLNSDDYYSNPTGLAESVKRLVESGADFSYSPIDVLSETTGRPVEHLICNPNIDMIFVEMPFSHQSMMFQRKAMLEIGGFDLRYSSGADYDSVLRLIFSNHRACFVPVKFVAFRLGGFSFINVEQSQLEVGTIFSRLYSQYLGVELSPEDGKKIYLTKQVPKALKQRQFAFARAAFGERIGIALEQNNEFTNDCDWLLLKDCLQNFSEQPTFFFALRSAVKLGFAHPLLALRLLHIYFFRKTAAARKTACDDLLCELEKKRKDVEIAGRKKTDRTVASEDSRLCVAYQDYWRTNGLYAGEAWGAWTGKTFSVFFKLPEEYAGQPLRAEIMIGGYVFPDSPKRAVTVVINGKSAGTLTLERMMPELQCFDIPSSAITSDILDMDFIVDQAFVPKTLKHGEDTRELGMTFQKLSIQKANGKSR